MTLPILLGLKAAMNRDRKTNLRKAGFATLLAAVLLSCLLAFLLPGGAESNWKKVFRFCGLGEFSDGANGSPLAVHVLDVGKADSIFIESGGHYLLVDSGTSDRGRQVSDYLRRRGVKTLDCVVNTHPDQDHIGGLKDVLLNFQIRRYLSPALPPSLLPNSQEYRDVEDALKAKQISEEHPKPGDRFFIGETGVSVLGPVVTGNSTNNNSIILKLILDKTSFLLTGDSEKEEERSLLSSGEDLRANVLKIGHHGSDTSATPEFLEAVHPKYAAISVGDDSNNLPKPSVSKRLADAGIMVYRTDISGTIIFLSDGKKISVITQKK